MSLTAKVIGFNRLPIFCTWSHQLELGFPTLMTRCTLPMTPRLVVTLLMRESRFPTISAQPEFWYVAFVFQCLITRLLNILNPLNPKNIAWFSFCLHNLFLHFCFLGINEQLLGLEGVFPSFPGVQQERVFHHRGELWRDLCSHVSRTSNGR